MSLEYRHANEIIITKSKHVLWLGDCAAAEDLEWIHKNNIRMVITAAAGFDIHYDASIRHHKYSLYDVKTENLLPYFDEVGEKIDKGLKWGSVLVHCGAGVSRSATLVLAYLIKYCSMGFLQALKFTKSKRPQICPNLGFELQLKKYAQPKKILSNLNSASFHNSLTTTNSFLKRVAETTIHNFMETKMENQSFPQINRTQHKSNKKNDIRGLTQPRGWRISYNLKPQFISNSLDPKKEAESYIKNIAKFRFGTNNTSNWGIH